MYSCPPQGQTYHTTHHNVGSYDLRIHTDGLDKKGLRQRPRQAGGKEPETHLGPWAWLPGAPYPLRALLISNQGPEALLLGRGPGQGVWNPSRCPPHSGLSHQEPHFPRKKPPGGEKSIITNPLRSPPACTHQEANKGAPRGLKVPQPNRGGKLGGLTL